MPVAEEQTNVLATAAAAAATGAAVYGLRKALSSNGAPSMLRHGEDSDDGDDEAGEGRVHSLLATVWDSVEGSLSPIADQAAQAAGRWAAENSPEFVRARIPSFIEAFEDAQ
jgi:hypothetical protein